MHRSFYLLRLGLSLVFLFNLYLLNGQTSEQVNNADSTQTKITSYAVENLGSEIEATFALIREVENIIKTTNEFIINDSSLYKVMKEVKEMKEKYNPDSINDLTYRTVDALGIQVNFSRITLDKYKRKLSERSGILEKKLSYTIFVRQRWELTQKTAIKEDRPDKLLSQIRDNITLLKQKEVELHNLQNKILNLQSDVTDQVVFLDEFHANVNLTLDELKGNILSLNYPPLWKTLQLNKDSLGIKYDIINTLTKKKEELNNNLNKNLSGLYKFIVLFIFIYFSLIYIKNRIVDQGFTEYNKYVSSSLVLLKHPYSLAIIICLLFLEIFIPNEYTSIYLSFRIFYIVPLITLIPKISKQIPSKLYIFYGLFTITEIIESLFIDIVIIHQIELLTQAILGIILAYEIQARLRITKKQIDKTLYVFLILLLRVAYIGYFLAFIFAIVGNSNLSNLLTDGFFKMIFGGIFVATSTYVLINLIGLGVKYGRVINSNILKEYPNLIMNKVTKNLKILSFIYWLYFSLNGFLIFDAIYTWAESVLKEQLSLGNISLSLGSILAFFITLYISFILTRLIRFILDDEVFMHFKMPRGIPGAISMIVRLALISLGFIFAFAAANIDVSNITIIFGALGVGIGFGLQNIFNNLVSGLILAFERPIQVGDTIELDTLKVMGEVKEIGIRASTIRTFDGAEVIVPNGNLISNEMVNWTLSDHTRRQEMMVGVAYGSDLAVVLRVLENTILEEPIVLNNPSPRVLFHGFGDSSIDFRLLYWTNFDNGLTSKSALGFAINKAFELEGINIPFPQRDVHIIQSPISKSEKGEEKSKKGLDKDVNQA